MDILELLERLRSSARALSTQQLTILGIAFTAVVSVTIGSAYWVNAPTYAVLFSEMDTESAGAVVAKLKNDKVPFTLDDGGKTVRVPATQVDELRLTLASQGMPTAGRIGFEIFDRTAFGVTDFLEHVNYRRALEGELARTISTIAEVASARVHIAMAQPSLFASQDQAAKASVVLKLRGSRRISPSTVAAITGLVAASVEALKPEAVVIIDNFGRPLTRSEDPGDEPLAGQQFERQQRLEHELSVRVVSLLDPIVGPGRTRVNVSAKLTGDSQEETEERWDPTPVIRSRQSVSQAGSGMAGAQGVSGARANLPPTADSTKPAAPAPSPAPAAPATSSNTAETTNFELGKLTRHRVQPRGQIARLSVAVVLDDEHGGARDDAGNGRQSKPRSPADIQKIHDLVAASVGFDMERGDQLTVENIAFEDVPVEPVTVPGAWQRYGPSVMEIGRIAGILLIVAVAFFGVLRPLVRTTLSAQPRQLAAHQPSQGAVGAPRTVQDLESELDAELASVPQSRRLPVLTRRVAALTQREPENTARLVRTWLTQDER